MGFLPTMYTSEKERAKLSHLFETDMHGEEFYKLSMECGGQGADEIILDILRHCSRMGYMDIV